MFSDGEARERPAAIGALARELGYQRTGIRIQEELDNALRTAVRRGILLNEHGALRLYARTIEQYERDFLKSSSSPRCPDGNGSNATMPSARLPDGLDFAAQGQRSTTPRAR
jgi:hypothetical protein